VVDKDSSSSHGTTRYSPESPSYSYYYYYYYYSSSPFSSSSSQVIIDQGDNEAKIPIVFTYNGHLYQCGGVVEDGMKHTTEQL